MEVWHETFFEVIIINISQIDTN